MLPANRTRCLVVAGPAALTVHTSGATLRLATIRRLLESHYDVEVVTPSQVAVERHRGYELVVGISWPTLGALRRLAHHNGRIWFDATDATTVLRPSLARSGMWKQPLALVRDIANASVFRPDLVTYIAERDRNRDGLLWSKTPVHVLPPEFELPPRIDGSAGGRLLLVGNGLYRPNADAVRWIVRKVLPEMRRRGCARQVSVIGAGFEGWSGDGVHFEGYVDDAADLYRPGDVHLAPIRFGAGMKSKVLMPLLMGNRVVTTREGAVGLKSVTSLWVSDDVTSFVDAIEHVSSLPAKRRLLQPADVLDCDEREVVELLIGAWSGVRSQ